MRILRLWPRGHFRKIMVGGILIVVPLAMTLGVAVGFQGAGNHRELGGIVNMVLLVYVVGQIWEIGLGRKVIQLG